MLRTACIAAAIQAVLAGTARAVPVEWNEGVGANGHAYEFVSSPGITWSSARALAESQTYLGVRGHLAAVASSQENAFVRGLVNIPGVTQAWLGAYQPNPLSPPASGWVWTTGEPFVFTNWAPGEPNDAGGDEHEASMFGGLGGPAGRWNDEANPGNVSGFVVEFSGTTRVVECRGTALAIGIGHIIIEDTPLPPSRSGSHRGGACGASHDVTVPIDNGDTATEVRDALIAALIAELPGTYTVVPVGSTFLRIDGPACGFLVEECAPDCPGDIPGLDIFEVPADAPPPSGLPPFRTPVLLWPTFAALLLTLVSRGLRARRYRA
jgi:hypothetical protein